MTDINKIVFKSNQIKQEGDIEHGSNQPSSLADELLKLIDDFSEYSNISAFMSNAFASTLMEHEWLNQEIISGARICSGWVQQMTVELKDEIRHVQERYAAEHTQASPTGDRKTGRSGGKEWQNAINSFF